MFEIQDIVCDMNDFEVMSTTTHEHVHGICIHTEDMSSLLV